MASLRLGFGTGVIDLGEAVRMGGYAARTGRSTGCHDPLTATALVADDGARPVAVVSIDAVAVTAGLKAQVLRAVPALATESLLLAATHTHSGPGGDPLDLLVPRAYYDVGTMRALVAGIVRALSAAEADLRTTRTEIRSGTIAGIASDRVLGLAEAPAPAALVLVRNGNGAPVGAVVNYACHPTVLDETNLRLSADYVAGLRARVRELTGAPHVLFLNGACGDLSTRFSRRESSVAEASRLGRIAADQVCALPVRPGSGGAVGSALSVLPVPNRPLGADAPVLRAGSSGERGLAAARYAVGAERQLRGVAGLERSQVPVQAIRLGGVRVVGLSVELFHRLRPDWDRELGGTVLLACYANDHHGYAVTPDTPPEAYERFGTLLPDTAGGRITAAATDLLRCLP